MQDKIESIYDKLMVMHEDMGKLKDHMGNIDEDIGCITTDISRINKTIRGNGTPGMVSRIEILEEEINTRASSADLSELKGRISERVKSVDKKFELRRYRTAAIATIMAALIGGCATLYVRTLQQPTTTTEIRK
jgi:archaellum component FlaC